MLQRSIVITGATSGIGLEAARQLATRGSRLILACRNLEKAARLRDELEAASDAEVELAHLDLASLQSVRDCAERIAATHDSVDVLVNNAGTFSMTRRETLDGFELTMGTNHFGPFLLTSLLLPLLRRAVEPARIVNVASAAYRYGSLRMDDLQRTRWGGNVGWAGFQAYAASRLATVLFTRELGRRLDPVEVTANCVHPGHVATNIFPAAPGLMGLAMRLSARLRIPAEEGARPVARLAVDDRLEGVTGEYFNRFEREEVPGRLADSDLARHLWAESCALTGARWDLAAD